MGHTVEVVPLSKLVLDLENARLGEAQDSQPEAFAALAKQQGHKLIELAKDIVAHGVDPTTVLAVVATDGKSRRYRVLEGNRRTLALKALETPQIVMPALDEPDRRQLVDLSKKFHEDPVEELLCVLFDSEDDARHWIKLRHTGANGGVGLVEWNSDEKDRFDSRHGGLRSPAGQVVDFLDELDGGRQASAPRIPVTTLNRLLNDPEVRERLGLTKSGGRLLAHSPQREVAKGLRKLVDDLRSEKIKVGDVYTKEQRREYIHSFGADDLPDPTTRFDEALSFDELPTAAPRARSSKPRPKSRPKAPTVRVTVVPSSCQINPSPPRINGVFTELAGLDVTTFPNAASVLLRVFLELSVDHYLEQHAVMTEAARKNQGLAKRLKAVADHLVAQDLIQDALKKAVYKVADGQHTIAASVTTFNQYVHNEYVHPKPSEIQTAWDELQPFLEKVWA